VEIKVIKTSTYVALVTFIWSN